MFLFTHSNNKCFALKGLRSSPPESKSSRTLHEANVSAALQVRSDQETNSQIQAKLAGSAGLLFNYNLILYYT